ncbi:MAG: carbohydrate ABC transporter permease [Erysipelotrichaceae bacterium]
MGTKITKILLYIFIFVLSVVCLAPFIIMILNSTRSGQEIMSGFKFVIGDQLAVNWKTVNQYLNIFQGLGNSAFVAICATALTAYFSAITAYGFAFFKFKSNKVIFLVILILMMVPAQLGLLGFYDLVNKLKLINSYIPLIIPAIAVPGTVFFLRQYVKTVLPPSILDAARIDGASELGIFHRIVLPIMAPGIATVSIGAFIGSWNSYILPLVILTKEQKFTLPLLIANMNAEQDIVKNQGAIYLALAISVIPILLMFAFFSKYIISSISAGAVKE